MGKYFIKEGSYRLFRSIAKAGKEVLIGTEKVKIKPGIMFEDRTKAKQVFEQVKSAVNPFRARIKSPDSIQANLTKNKQIGDLLGMQIYSRKPQQYIEHLENIFKQGGGEGFRVKRMNKPGYVGANISGKLHGVETEVQVSPGYRANFGQILQHDSYKPPTGYTDWDKDKADKIGRWLVDKGIAKKPEWLEFLGKK